MAATLVGRLVRGPFELTAAAIELGTVSARQAALTAPVLGESVRALPRLATSLERLAAAAVHLEHIATLGQQVVDRVDTPEFRAEVARLVDTAHRVAGITGAITELPARVGGIDASISSVTSRLTAVEPDIRALSAMLTALDESIRVLALAISPLQGTTERLGRLLDRLPDRRKRRPEAPAGS